ncbi:Phr family secreted Rap phosphatase inhibitor [Bacillus thuringiensis]|uniref:Phr family secreted Rap phosphatase inhibitor n=1 Tax=Bacillus thuringiensis TaxID=1428 RepID=UPI000BF82EBF|nr:Phr family secreted Rap phosphatase inhibitor [Bacillus thuringiensis]PEV86527.1 Phr family secreted Rap phosphatase inhibitor [Bacillus thuringiensis]
MKKFRLAIVGTALVGVLSIGFNSSFTNQAVNIGDTGGAPADNKGDGGVSQL